jgi:TraM recognition site of TraD and TraG
MRRAFEFRAPINLAVAGAIGVVGLHNWPFPADDAFLAAIEARKPWLFEGLAYLYATLWFSTPLIMLSVTSALLYVAVMRGEKSVTYGPLPRYPDPSTRTEPFLVLGEQHHPTRPVRVPQPTWLTIPRRGLHTGVMILGAVGTGKTSACMYPYVDQLLAWRSRSADEKIGGLILEVKGDFCGQVRAMLARHNRANDYIEIGLDSPYCYNPLHNDLEPYALAYSIATLLNNLYGRGKEPFWQQAYTDLVKFLILLRKVVDGYTTLTEVYRYAIDESLIERDLQRGEEMFASGTPSIRIAACDYHLTLAQSPWPRWSEASDDQFTHPHNDELEAFLKKRGITCTIDKSIPPAAWDDRQQQLAAVKRWYYSNWIRLEPRLRSSIVEGIVVFLSLFDDNPAVARAFCPPKSAYIDPPMAGQKHGTPLPPLDELLEAGKVLALNFPVGLNPGLARALGVMLKLDFQRAVLGRIAKMNAAPEKLWRDLLFVCDEYHTFATTGDTDPSGDERTFALSRQARLIPIVATQSISSLRSAVHGEESWRTLLQCFRTKLFLASSDEFTTRVAAELCGRAERLKPSYQLTEAGQDARVSLLTGRAAAPKATVTASKHYAFQLDYVFQPKIFGELQNGQAIVLPYDGLNPKPPTYCYLKPHYLDVQTSYFDHVARGRL